MTDPTRPHYLRCEYFVLCDRPADGLAPMPGARVPVPCCQRCADRVGVDLDPSTAYDAHRAAYLAGVLLAVTPATAADAWLSYIRWLDVVGRPAAEYQLIEQARAWDYLTAMARAFTSPDDLREAVLDHTCPDDVGAQLGPHAHPCAACDWEHARDLVDEGAAATLPEAVAMIEGRA